MGSTSPTRGPKFIGPIVNRLERSDILLSRSARRAGSGLAMNEVAGRSESRAPPDRSEGSLAPAEDAQ